MKPNIKPWLLVLYLIAMLAGIFLAGWLASKLPFLAALEWPELILHGLWLVLMGVYLFTTRKEWAEKHPRGVRIGKRCQTIAVLCLTLSVILQTAFLFAGI